MIELPVYVVFLVVFLIGVMQGFFIRKSAEEDLGDPEFFKTYCQGLAVDVAVYCLALWLVSLVWNG